MKVDVNSDHKKNVDFHIFTFIASLLQYLKAQSYLLKKKLNTIHSATSVRIQWCLQILKKKLKIMAIFTFYVHFLIESSYFHIFTFIASLLQYLKAQSYLLKKKTQHYSFRNKCPHSVVSSDFEKKLKIMAIFTFYVHFLIESSPLLHCRSRRTSPFEMGLRQAGDRLQEQN